MNATERRRHSYTELDVDDEDHEDLKALGTEVTERVEIRLEHKAHYNWVAFVSQRESDIGALTKYFEEVTGEDDFKIRGSGESL